MPPKPKFRHFGATRTKAEVKADAIAERGPVRGLYEQLSDYVLAHRAGKVIPIPTLERAIVWAQENGTVKRPVRIRQRGKLLYRYPEKK